MNIEDTLEDLYSCLPRDRKKFNYIMEDMKKKFLRKARKQNNKYNQIPKLSFLQANRDNISSNINFASSTNYNNNLNYIPKPFNTFNINNNMNNNNNNNNNQLPLPYLKYEQSLNFKPIKVQENANYYNTQNHFYPEQMRINNFDRINKKSVSNGFQGTLPDALLISPKPFRTNSQQKLLSDTHANCNFYYPEKNKELYDSEIDVNSNGWHNQANNIMFNTSDNFFIKNK